MTQLADSGVESAGFEAVGTGLNVYESADVVEGVVRWLDSPDEVIAFVDSGDVSDVIVIARGGTTTFLSMALNAGVRGVVTLQGAPESHLGILCREYGIPCVMGVTFTKGVRTPRGEIVPADGVRMRLDVSSRPQGTVSVEAGAPVDDSPVEAAGPAMTEEQLAQIMLLLEKFGGVVPKGNAGHAVMEAEMATRVLYADDDSMHRELTRQEINEAVRYYTWNEWNCLASRAQEGESGLIPRQEYEAMGIMNCWFMHPEWLEAIQNKVGIDGMIKLGSLGRTELGTKMNMLHIWALATAPSFGRGIAIELNLHDVDFKADRIRRDFQVVRRLYKGLWGDGPMLTSMMNFEGAVLDRSWVDRFTADRIALDDDQARATFQRFNGAAEMMGFLLHFDNRLGVGDHGPYKLADGGFVLVRDIFLNEPAFPWSDAVEGMPHAVTVAMFFPPDARIEVEMVDISTVFTTPANYLPSINGVAVYVREAWDTPMDQLRTLNLDEMAAMRPRLEEQAAALYKRIAAMSQREKIEAGAMVYTAGFALPVARAAGMLDELATEHDFFAVHPAVTACYETIISGVATEMIPRLFLTGSWGNPVPEQASDSLAGNDAEFRVLHALRVRGVADVATVAESSGLDADTVTAVLTTTCERGHTKERTGRVTGHSLTPAGRARHVLLRGESVSAAGFATALAAYDAFLEPNRAFKQLTGTWQTGQRDDAAAGLAPIHAQATALLAGLTPALPWFAGYGTRLESAYQSFVGGNADALAKPLSGSYHDIWMELHEDLLATLGRERLDADE
jgi:PEP-utilising enzyme, mobile domain